MKEGIFDGPQIRTVFQDKNFTNHMNNTEKAAWQSFKNVSLKCLGNEKNDDYQNFVEDLLKNFEELGCLMNLKLHFLHSHLDYFPENLGDFSKEQRERFHQDINEMEKRYQGRWDVNMMADFYWTLKRETNQNTKKRKRNPLHRSFEEKRVRYKRKKNIRAKLVPDFVLFMIYRILFSEFFKFSRFFVFNAIFHGFGNIGK